MRILLVTIVVLCALGRPADAGDLVISGSLEGQDTAWDTDSAGYGKLMTDYRFGFWSLSFVSKLGYGTVDERVLEYLDLGARFWRRLGRTSLYIRPGLVHQHEIPRESIEAGRFSTAIGVGDGIRHRAGVSAGGGVLVDLLPHKHGTFFAVAHVSTAYMFENEKGPSAYWGAGLGIGFTYELTIRVGNSGDTQ